MEGRIDAVEIFRKAHGIGSSREDSHDSYAASMQTPEPGAEDLPSSIDWKAAYEVLTAKYRTLEKEKGSAEQEVVCLEIETKSLQQEKAGMDKDKKRVQETLRKAKEEKAALEIENCVLQMENEELKSKTDSVRETLGSLRLQLDGEGSDGEGYGTPRTSAEGRSAKAPSTTSKNPFDFTFQSSRNDAMKRPLATPRDSVVPSSPIGVREADAKQTVGGVNGLSPEGGIRPQSSSSSPNSSPKLASTKLEKRAMKMKVPHGFRVRPRSAGIGGGMGNEDE